LKDHNQDSDTISQISEFKAKPAPAKKAAAKQQAILFGRSSEIAPQLKAEPIDTTHNKR
jgi:hypothetical protein